MARHGDLIKGVAQHSLSLMGRPVSATLLGLNTAVTQL